MKIEDQVCSLEYAKKLKELGVKYDSYFYYVFSHRIKKYYIYSKDEFLSYDKSEDFMTCDYQAFTVAELLEMMPSIKDCEPELIRGHLIGEEQLKYCVRYGWEDEQNKEFLAINPCDSLAKMLIYLIENKLMEIEK